MKTVACRCRRAAVAAILVLTGCSRPIPTPLLEAQQFLRNAPAYQERSTTETVLSYGPYAGRHSSLTQRQFVRGGPLRLFEVYDGRPIVEVITDGEREFGPNEQGEMEEEHGDAARAYADQVSRSLRTVVPSRFDEAAKMTGHENVAGVAATVYTWSSRRSALVREAAWHWTVVRPTPKTTRLWIADDNHRPLQVQARREAQVVTTIFSYDPSVRVSLPGG